MITSSKRTPTQVREAPIERGAMLLALAQVPRASATDLLEALQSELRTHIAHAEQFDDITLMAVKRQ